MSDNTSFLNLVRGNRLSAYMGLKLGGKDLSDATPKFSPDYSYVEVPLKAFFNPADEKLQTKALRNQYLQLIPDCTLEVKGYYHVLVEPNPALAAWGLYQPGYYLHPGSGVVTPSIFFSPRKDLEVEELPYAVRLYLRA